MPYPTKFLSNSLTALLLSVSFCVVLQAQEVSNTPASIFSIPEDAKTFKQLMAFVQELDAKEPEDRSEKDLLAHRRKVTRTMVAVTEQAMSLELAGDETMECHYYHLLALDILLRLDEPQAKEKFAQAVEVARAHSNPDVAAVGIKFLVESGFSNWKNLSEQEKAQLIDSIVEHVQNAKVSGEHVQLIMTVVGFLSNVNDNQLAKHLLQEISPAFLNSPNKQLQAIAITLKGISRRLDLPGKKMDLFGTMLDGSELDWSSYRGKVVLVDFWATWCGPCRAEVPNILNMYRAYHEKGFEVIGISLDTNAKQAEAYLKQMNIPWATMFSKDKSEHPMAVHYGVTGIPLAILVDRDGTVISMQAQGQNLSNLLRRVLGEPMARTKSSKETLVQ